MKKKNYIGKILVIFLFATTLLLFAACGGGDAADEPERTPDNSDNTSISIKTGILIEASMREIVIQAPDGSTYVFGISNDTLIEGSEYLGNTMSVYYYGNYTPGIIAATVKTIVEVDHDSTPDKGYITEPDAPQPKEPPAEDETIWYLTGTVVDISATGLHLLYEDGITYSVMIDENTKKDSGLVAGCVARVFRKGRIRDGMLAIEIHYIAAAPTPAPLPTPTPTPDPERTPTPPPAEDPEVPPGDIIQHAKSLIGAPYKSGGASIAEGFDNSGFIYYVLNHNGIKCPRLTREQVAIGQKITDYADLQATDLIFFSDGSGGTTVQYGGIYIGDGKMIYCSYSDMRITQRDLTQWHKDAFVLGVRIK